MQAQGTITTFLGGIDSALMLLFFGKEKAIEVISSSASLKEKDGFSNYSRLQALIDLLFSSK
ncbi:hypothetical protein [Ulvibacterium marinum]|uniref:hypothetical protein n=1 Tax=Ulvibacterium marinum TaxID=2419782 RepID=UPI002493F89A|nr:hypothetical protein [Ulvibacterium marinum]